MSLLIHGDALDVLRGMPSESANIIPTSPPYWQHAITKPTARSGGNERSGSTWIVFSPCSTRCGGY